jgi:hypothetical protein
MSESTDLEYSESTRRCTAAKVKAKLKFWRSPPDQPKWARPALLVIAASAAVSYSWGINNFPLEPFYAAAARSMGSSWRDFFFGAVDPAGTVTVDKLPGAFWVQALVVRVFGFHYWCVAVPQVLAGVLTVLVLFRVARRLSGPGTALVAVLILAASPVTALLNRGNVSDSLLALLTVLAADGRLSQFFIPISPAGNDPRLIWVRHHCLRVSKQKYGPGVQFGLLTCAPSKSASVVAASGVVKT